VELEASARTAVRSTPVAGLIVLVSAGPAAVDDAGSMGEAAASDGSVVGFLAGSVPSVADVVESGGSAAAESDDLVDVPLLSAPEVP